MIWKNELSGERRNKEAHRWVNPDEFDECSSDEEKDNIFNFFHSISYFYGLMKIHKSTIITRAIGVHNSI